MLTEKDDHAVIRAVYLLLFLGIIAQVLLIYYFRNDLVAARRDDAGGVSIIGVLISIAPAILAVGGATAAWALKRRGSRWAWLAVGGPLVILAAGFGAGAYLAAYPLPLLGGYGGLPL
ncbi:hypothetical protein VQH23_03945 [Pararoseomonas sp. SCSIO 73927]|uniref:hypothetical protein n=1 Tax=Pararoseomonas sp. SCSIO 73927 TaxID=3114537 RepID=UPI0030D2F886